LRYAHEVRSETEYFADIPKIALPDEMLQIAEHILDTKLADFDPAYLEDRYRTVLAEKLREKKAQPRDRRRPSERGRGRTMRAFATRKGLRDDFQPTKKVATAG
jgi:non-homologous end joining protein Ku